MSKAASRAVLAATALATACLAWHQMAILGDGFWSLACGRWLLEHRALPHGDPFAFASAGSRWILDSALRDVIFVRVTKLGGLRGLMIFCAIVEAAAPLLVWSRARTPIARLVLVPLVLFYVQVDAQDLSARGQIFGDVGFVVLLAMLSRLRDGKRVHPALFVLLAAAWASLHLSFLITVALPLGVAAMLLLEPREERPALRPFVVASALALAGTFLNPYGWRYLRYAFGIGFDPSTSTLDLFRSPDLHDPSWLLAPALGVALVVARGRFGEERGRRSEQAFVLAFIAAACSSRRYATELVAVEIALAAPLLDAIVISASRARAWVALSVASSIALFAASVKWILEPHDPYRDAPVEAAAYSRGVARDLQAKGELFARVADPLHWGGYLAYAWDGDPKYMIDGRDHLILFGNGSYDDASKLWSGAADWADVLDTYEIGVVLWERGSILDAYMRRDPRWRLVHEDRIAVVYLRVK